jgi:FlaA1/EpsC-like NDP-sugar epimerase
VEEVGLVFSGLRPGEKLFEELLADADNTVPTPIERLRLARLDDQSNGIRALLNWLDTDGPHGADAIRQQLMVTVGGYQPAPSGARLS